jgi:hypothetical protein
MYCVRTWHFINTLFDSPWFSRMWTIQEVAMAQQVVFQLGSGAFTWDELVRCGMPEYTDNPMPRGARFEGFKLRNLLQGLRRAVAEEGPEQAKGLRMADVFMCTRNHGATEVRDRIFALYWVFQMAGVGLPAPVRAIVEQDRSLGFLATIGSEGQDPSFPSWLPDFRSLSSHWKTLGDLEETSKQVYYSDHSKKWRVGHSDVKHDHITRLPIPRYSLDTSKKSFTVQGRILGSVWRIADQMPSDYSVEELSDPSPFAQIDYIRILRSILSLLPLLDGGRTQDTREQALWKVLIQATSGTSPPLFTEWCSLLQAEESSLKTSYASFEDIQRIETEAKYYWKKDIMWPFEELFATDEGREKASTPEFKILMSVLPDGQMGSHHIRMVRELSNKRVFVCWVGNTETYMSIGGPSIREGDQVALIDGLEFPIILRKESDTYRFCGPGFVHGLTTEHYWPKSEGEMEAITLR